MIIRIDKNYKQSFKKTFWLEDFLLKQAAVLNT